jgi:hypothetical protein
MADLQIVQALPHDVEQALGFKIDMPVLSYVGVDGREIVGAGGLAWGKGKCWLWLSVYKSNPGYGVPIMKMMKRLVKKAAQLGETAVYTPRDAAIETSAKILKVLGFSYHETDENGIEVYVKKVEP